MSDGDGGIRPSTFFIYDPPGGGMCSRNAPGPVKDRSGLRRGMCSILPLFTPGLAQPGACAGLKPANFCRPVPGDRLDERTAGRYVCHVCVMFVSYLCHNCVIYEQKFNFSAGRPPDRPKAKKGPSGFLCCNIKIKKPRLHARAHHARLTRACTCPPARITRACVK